MKNTKKALVESPKRLAFREELDRSSAEDLKNPEPAGKRVYKRPKQKRVGTTPAQGFLGFLFATLVLGILLLDQVELVTGIGGTHFASQRIYTTLRNVLIGTTYILLLMEAFQHNMIHGTVGLLIPPYIVFYGLILVDSNALKGFTFAVLVFMGVEWHYLGQTSSFNQILLYVDSFIDQGNSMIHAAGNEDLKK